MRYTFCPADPVWYATDLRLDPDRGMLQWTGGRGQDALLVRTPYGTDPETRMDALCAALEQTDLREGRFTELAPPVPGGTGGGAGGDADGGAGNIPPGTAVRLVSALEKARRNGCPPDGAACTYTVFACRTVPAPDGGTDGVRFLYGHQRGEMSSPRCDVPLRLRVDVEAAAQRGLLARLARKETGFYRIVFPPDCPEGFRDGDLEYRAEGFAVPVTRRMVEAGAVYVRTDQRPRVASRTAGLVLEGG